MIILADQADLQRRGAHANKGAKGRFVRDALWNKSQATQAPILKWLDEHQLEHRSFYIVNAIWVKGRYEDALALARAPTSRGLKATLKSAFFPATNRPSPLLRSQPLLTRLNLVSLTLMLLLFGRKDSSARASWWPVQTPVFAGLITQSNRTTAVGMESPLITISTGTTVSITAAAFAGMIPRCHAMTFFTAVTPSGPRSEMTTPVTRSVWHLKLNAWVVVT